MDIRAQVISLNEDRARVFNQQEKLMEETRGRERSEEEKNTLTKMDADIDRIDGEIRAAVARDTREREAGQLREANAGLFGADGDRKLAKVEQNENDTLRAWLNGDASYRKANPFEINIDAARKQRELLRQGYTPQEIRAIAWDTGSVASGVPTIVASSLYETLEAFTTMFRAPTTKFPTSNGDAIKFPKVNAHAIATQVSGQGTTLAGTDPTFLSVTLDAFKYGELVIVANEVLTDVVFPIAEFVGRDIGRALGRKIDEDLTVGSGSGAPNGIMTAVTGAGTVSTGGSLIDPTYEALVNLQYSVADAYRAGGAAGWLMRDSTAGTLRKIRDNALAGGTSGAVMWEPSLTNGLVNGVPDRLLGFPVYTGAYVASLGSNNKIIGFGDFSAYYIRTVGNIMLESDASRYFDTDQTGFRGKWRIDGDLIDATAFNILKRSV